MTPEDIRRAWLSGTTCSSKRNDPREVLFVSDTFIVLRHRAHVEYIDRVRGSDNCEAYCQLHVRKDLTKALLNNSRYGGLYEVPLLEWKGRLNLSKIRAECKAVGAVFD
jgi:hypothetical protein